MTSSTLEDAQLLPGPAGPDAKPRRGRSGPGAIARFVRRLSVLQLIGLAVALFAAVVAVYPVIRVLISLFWADGRFTTAPLHEAFAVDGLGSLVANTVIVVVASSAIALVVGSVLAWLNERTDARMSAVSDSLPLIPFLVPQIAGAVGWVLLLSPQAGLLNAVIRKVMHLFGSHATSGPLDIYTWYGLIFVYTIYQVPLVFLMVSNGLRNADPGLDEQSRVCGAGLWRTLRQVTMPSIKQHIGGSVLLMFVQGFSLYSVPVIIGTGAHIDVLPVRIVNLLSFSYPPQQAAAVGLSVIMVLFVGAAWLVQARLLSKGQFTTIGGKGQKIAPIELGGWKWPLRGGVLLYGLVSVILPTVALVLVTLNGFWTPDIAWSKLGFSSLTSTVFDDPSTMTALKNSVWIGVVGASIGMVLAVIISLYMRGRRSVGKQVLDGAIKIPSVISHIVIAVGLILGLGGGPFWLGGTTTILLIAYVSIYLPQGSIAADTAVSQIGKELPEASAVSGAGALRTFRRVYLPLMLPGLVAGWAFLFVRMVGDLTATAILSGTGNDVVGFRILEIFQQGSFAQLASLAIVLTVITAVVVVGALGLSRLLGGRQRSRP